MAKETQKRNIKKVAEGQIEKKIEEKIVRSEEETKVTSNLIISSIPFIISAILWILLWIIPNGPAVVDPWYKAVKLVDSASKIQDNKIRYGILEEGGNQLRDLTLKHPYHARVHFFLGYYYFVSQKWDSALTSLKESARIDSGATINAVWPDAHDLIAKSALNKALVFIQQNQFKQAKEILLDAYDYYPKHPILNKFLGSVNFNLGEYELALRYSMISFSGNPKDSEVANLIGTLYKMKNDLVNASAYYRKAVELDPNNQTVLHNLNSLNLTK
jgi:tetratricopeptide (TPR) repeat protein